MFLYTDIFLLCTSYRYVCSFSAFHLQIDHKPSTNSCQACLTFAISCNPSMSASCYSSVSNSLLCAVPLLAEKPLFILSELISLFSLDLSIIGWIFQWFFSVELNCSSHANPPIASYDIHSRLQCNYSLLPLRTRVSHIRDNWVRSSIKTSKLNDSLA